ncbi:patatin-like phospholipase family protein [Sulfuricystis multivorans]|uniref:patatin-like phospholipase family protein n=1 Tax=Sulfuricystis multivorans TaxID=2211108 RepID=UPI000F847B1D|nr:patatin-like phospholipase family protein [Sulfuricystis multivorans]
MISPPTDTLSARHAALIAAALKQMCGTLDETSLAALLGEAQVLHLPVGNILYRQGEPGDCLHIVLSGRLQVRVREIDGQERIVAYPQPGDVVGEIALLSGSGRAATITAVRDTILAALPRAAIDRLIAHHPQAFTNIARMVIARLTGQRGHIATRSGARTLMIVPLHRTVDVHIWCDALRSELLRFGAVLQLDAAAANARFGTPPGPVYGHHLDRCEQDYDFLLLVANPLPDEWNRICRGYADKIVLVADAALEPNVTELERWLFDVPETQIHHCDVHLALTHRTDTQPQRTRDWLAARRVDRHHHLRSGNREDMARLARFLSGHAVGLVLAGGGARGFAHLGAIRALGEAGVPIDMIGGASFGALAATGLARGLSDAESFAEHRLAFTSEDPLGDYTLPVVSLVRGEHLNRVLRSHLPMDIEDLWLPFFAVSSDLSANRVRVHERGPLWQAIRASVSLPAILPPAIEDGHLLVDGGVLNNLPIDIMRERMQGKIIAIDLAVEALEGTAYQRIPGSLEYLADQLLPGRAREAAPTLSRVILQVTTLASRKEVQHARKLADLYLNPPLDDFDFLDWRQMRAIAAAGYQHALPRAKEWLARHPQYDRRAGFMNGWQFGQAA